MEATLFINTDLRAARKAATGIDVPIVTARQRAALSLSFKFFETDAAPALLSGSPTFRLVLKATPTGDPFAFTSTVAETLADGYKFTFTSIDSASLRTLLGDQRQIEGWVEIEWTIGSVIERVASPLIVQAAYHATDEEAPDPLAEASDTWLTARAVRHDEAQTLTTAAAAQALENLNITFTAAGYLQLQNAAGDTFHIPLNSGTAPG